MINEKTTEYTLSFSIPEGITLKGRIHSVYEHAVNLEFVIDNQKKLITVLEESTPFVVESFAMKKEAFELIKKSEKADVSFSKKHIIIDNINIELENRKDSYLQKRELDKSAVKELISYEGEIKGLYQISEKRKQYIKEKLIRFAESGDFEDVTNIIGFGSGLTPGSDDAIAGVMIILHNCGKMKPVDINRCYNIIKGLTTDVSVKYLLCALENHFSQRLLEMIESLNKNEGIRESADRLSQIGATSGKDMLQGIIIGLNENYLG